MSDGKSVLPLLTRFQRSGPVIAFLGLVGCVFGLILDREHFFQGYFFAYIFWVGLTLGCFALAMLQYVIRGSFGAAILRPLEAGTRMLPFMALLFLPIALGAFFGFHHLYPWADPRAVAGDPVLQHRAGYMNPGGFLLRALIYFALWIGISTCLNRWSLEQDGSGDPTLAQKRTNLSAPGMVIYVITVTAAFTDWVMSLDPHWYSTLYGFWFVVGQALSAMSFLTLFVTLVSDRKPFSEVVTAGVLRDLGNLLLTLTMLWGYMALSQFLIMWSGNLPEEVEFYFKRQHGIWLVLGTVVVICQFFAPFLALLSGRAKRTPRLLGMVAGGMLLVRLLDLFWNIMPFFQTTFLSLVWALAALAGIGGIWIAVFAGALKRHPLLPLHDTGLQEALGHA